MTDTPLCVRFEVLTTNQMGKIGLELDRKITEDGTETWTISMDLFERLSRGAVFELVARTTAQVPEIDFAAARSMAAQGLCPEQHQLALVAAEKLKLNREEPDNYRVQKAVLQILRAGN